MEGVNGQNNRGAHLVTDIRTASSTVQITGNTGPPPVPVGRGPKATTASPAVDERNAPATTSISARLRSVIVPRA
jgi:hypothetical protein